MARCWAKMGYSRVMRVGDRGGPWIMDQHQCKEKDEDGWTVIENQRLE